MVSSIMGKKTELYTLYKGLIQCLVTQRVIKQNQIIPCILIHRHTLRTFRIRINPNQRPIAAS